VRNEWADAIFETAREIASAHDYIQAHLRGWITQQEMYDGTARHGMSPADTDLLYLRAGRPAAPGQMATAVARGVDGPDGKPMDHAQFLKGIRESDIRPEWAEMLWGIRFAYPPLFQLTRLVDAGAIDTATAVDWAQKDRYAPEVVAALEAFWSKGKGTTAKGLTATDLATEYEAGLLSSTEYQAGLEEIGYKPADAARKVQISEAKRLRDARRQLVQRSHTRYTGWHIDKPTALQGLAAAGIGQPEADELLTFWDAERQINVHTLTEAQVVRATRKAGMDQTTAEERLLELGLSQADIATRLAI